MRILIFSRQNWLPGIMRRRVWNTGGVRDWICSGKWSLNAPVTKKRAEISLHTTDDFSDAMFFDAIRFSTAAFESARAVKTYSAEPKSYAWQFISYYYAGYFAANALMRLGGYGCMNLFATECAEINQQALLFGVGGTSDRDKLAPGSYFSRTSLTGTPYWNLSLLTGKGGVHIQFWTAFIRFLDELRDAISTSSLPSNDRNAALIELDDLVIGLKHSNTQTGSWLSEVRNSMNYRLEYGAWFPYDGSVTDGASIRAALIEMVTERTGLPKSGQTMPDPTRAVRLSGFLLSWLKASFVALEATSSKKTKEWISKSVLDLAKCL